MDKTQLLNHFCNVKSSSGNKYTAACPCCEGNDPHGHHLGIELFVNGKTLLNCIKCNAKAPEITAAAGLKMTDLFEESAQVKPEKKKTKVEERTHVYHSADGEEVAKKIIRKYDDGSKDAIWMRFENGQYEMGLNHIQIPLYNAHYFRHYPNNSVMIAEGEKDAETLCSMGILATTIPNGGSQKTWLDSYTELIQGRKVYILTDNDDVGNEYGEFVASKVYDSATVVYVVPAKLIYPEVKAKGDISDIYELMGKSETIRLLTNAVNQLEPWTPKEQPKEDAPNGTETDHSVNLKPSSYTDLGNAEIFMRLYGHKVHYCNAIGWLCWNGSKWENNEHLVNQLAMDLAKRMTADAQHNYFVGSIDGEATKDAQKYHKNALNLQSNRGMTAMLALVKSMTAIDLDKLDANFNKLNTPAGIIDLKTGELLPHNPDELCTKMTTCAPSSEGEELWESFLDLVTCGDIELKRYLQIKLGSNIIGKVYEENILFADGTGHNGKSTLFNAIGTVIGDYSSVIDVDVLTTSKQNKGAELATLRGVRLAICGELEEGQRLSVATLKRIASTDKMKVEKKYCDPEMVTPSHHIVLFTNHLPRVGSSDSGTWRRINVAPFNATMPTGESNIPNYADYLAEKAGGAILKWLVDGAAVFIENGNKVGFIPVAMEEATNQYKQKEDWVSRFISECCVIGSLCSVRVGDLYERYKLFADSTGDYRRSMRDFNEAIEHIGFDKVSAGGHRTEWKGIGLPHGGDFADGQEINNSISAEKIA